MKLLTFNSWNTLFLFGMHHAGASNLPSQDRSNADDSNDFVLKHNEISDLNIRNLYSEGKSSIFNENGDRIINGEDAEQDEFPGYVRLGTGCGGSLIAPYWVLTAEHCGEDRDADFFPQPVSIGAYKRTPTDEEGSGSWNMSAYDGELNFCEEWFSHVGFDSKSYSYNQPDLALCRLQKPSEKIPYKIKKEFQGPDKNAIAIGFGSIEFDQDNQGIGDAPLVLQKTVAPILSNSEPVCDGSLRLPDQLEDAILYYAESQVCTYDGNPKGNNWDYTGSDQTNTSTCHGDSGGPLLVKDNVTNTLVIGGGALAQGQCVRPNDPRVWPRVHFGSENLLWIQTIICQLNGNYNEKTEDICDKYFEVPSVAAIFKYRDTDGNRPENTESMETVIKNLYPSYLSADSGCQIFSTSCVVIGDEDFLIGFGFDSGLPEFLVPLKFSCVALIEDGPSCNAMEAVQSIAENLRLNFRFTNTQRVSVSDVVTTPMIETCEGTNMFNNTRKFCERIPTPEPTESPTPKASKKTSKNKLISF